MTLVSSQKEPVAATSEADQTEMRSLARYSKNWSRPRNRKFQELASLKRTGTLMTLSNLTVQQ
ncbi:MAG: hypothetical protein CM15mP62_20400 [Rhodospirillaceae bacterium]|nr:MAG: hypothetical protein CM15mP62_20400 [Rhodospirillaceae bacterium]